MAGIYPKRSVFNYSVGPSGKKARRLEEGPKQKFMVTTSNSSRNIGNKHLQFDHN